MSGYVKAVITAVLLLVWAYFAYLSGRIYQEAEGVKRTTWRLILIAWFCLPVGWMSLALGVRNAEWLVVSLLLFTIAAIAFVTAFVAPLFLPREAPNRSPAEGEEGETVGEAEEPSA